MQRGHYNVLRPTYIGTGQMFTSIDRDSGRAVQREYMRVEWVKRGEARTMAEAKEKFGGCPVLEWVSGGSDGRFD